MKMHRIKGSQVLGRGLTKVVAKSLHEVTKGSTQQCSAKPLGFWFWVLLIATIFFTIMKP